MYIVTICVSNERNLTFVDTLYVLNLHFSHSNLANDVIRVIFRFQFSKNSRSGTVFKRQSLGKFWALFHKKTIPSPFLKIRERGLRYQNSLMTNWFKFQCWKKKTTSFVDFKSTNNSNATSWVIGRGWCFCFFYWKFN